MEEMWRLSPPDGDWCFLDRRSPGHKISAKNQYHLNRVSRLEAPTKESTGDRDLILSKYTYLYYIQQNILLRFNARALSERRIDAPETVGVECVTYESCGFKIWHRCYAFSSHKAWPNVRYMKIIILLGHDAMGHFKYLYFLNGK